MEFVQDILFAIIGAAVPVVTAFVCRWLVSLSDSNKEKVKNEKTQVTIGLVTDMIASAVETTTSTYVKQLKAEDLFNAEAQKEAFNRTFDIVKKQLTDDSKNIIAEVYGDVETYLTNKIEQYVEELKTK